MNKIQFDGPVVLAIMDGVGLAPSGPGNAVSLARTPFLAKSSAEGTSFVINASGEAVGLLPGVMGNSEVGHNTMGCGQIIKQGIAHIEDAFENGSIWDSEAWKGLVDFLLKDGAMHALHFSGIFSDGGVHSDIKHLELMMAKAYEAGIRKFRIHPVFDGRDVAPQSEPKYINRLERFAEKFEEADIKIASGGGRMTTTADRYENDWKMVERGFNAMVYGISDNKFHSALEAIETFRKKDPEIQDQYLPDFVVIDEDSEPVGKIKKGDAVIYIDFRADRAIEIASAFDIRDFAKFNRGNNFIVDDIYFAGLTEYDSDKHIPKNQLIAPNYITNTLSEYLGSKKISSLAISETVKFGHVTYFFNGNSNEPAPLEEFLEIPSYTEPFDTRPWMKCAEITDAVLENLDKYKFIRINFPGGDMVGHFAEVDPTIVALEAIDLSLARIAKKVEELGGCLIITADHGNAEELLDADGNPKTAHSLNKIPFIIYDKTKNRKKYTRSNVEEPGLANVAATIATLLGRDDYPRDWKNPLIVLK